jgi:hypothetical protein
MEPATNGKRSVRKEHKRSRTHAIHRLTGREENGGEKSRHRLDYQTTNLGATFEASLTIGWIGFDRGKTVSKLLALELLGLALSEKQIPHIVENVRSVEN